MDLNLTDKVTFVAGASRGIGLAIVEACLAEGVKVAMAARGEAALEEQRARLAAKYGEDKIWPKAGDLRDTETIDDMVEAIETDFGPLWIDHSVARLHHYDSFGRQIKRLNAAPTYTFIDLCIRGKIYPFQFVKTTFDHTNLLHIGLSR